MGATATEKPLPVCKTSVLIGTFTQHKEVLVADAEYLRRAFAAQKMKLVWKTGCYLQINKPQSAHQPPAQKIRMTQ